jgi:hypothetical protein
MPPHPTHEVTNSVDHGARHNFLIQVGIIFLSLTYAHKRIIQITSDRFKFNCTYWVSDHLPI